MNEIIAISLTVNCAFIIAVIVHASMGNRRLEKEREAEWRAWVTDELVRLPSKNPPPDTGFIR